jgi:hypothetical protein
MGTITAPAVRAAFALAAVTVGGCGDNLAQPDWWRDGSRMQARAWATESGYRYVFGWRDTMLDVTCDAGAPACAPLVQVYLADAACRELVAASVDELPPIAMYRDSRGGHGIRITGPSFTGSLYIRRDGCRLAGQTDPNFNHARAERHDDVLAPVVVPLDLGAMYTFEDGAFVALADPAAVALAEAYLDIQIEEGVDRLRTRYLVDGAFPLAAGIHDTVHGIRCFPGPDPTGALRCLPALEVPVYAAGAAFADPACSQPLDYAIYVSRGHAHAPGGDGYVRVDTEVTADVHVRAGTACNATGAFALWRGSEVIPATAFAPMFVEEVVR